MRSFCAVLDDSNARANFAAISSMYACAGCAAMASRISFANDAMLPSMCRAKWSAIAFASKTGAAGSSWARGACAIRFACASSNGASPSRSDARMLDAISRAKSAGLPVADSSCSATSFCCSAISGVSDSANAWRTRSPIRSKSDSGIWTRGGPTGSGVALAGGVAAAVGGGPRFAATAFAGATSSTSLATALLTLVFSSAPASVSSSPAFLFPQAAPHHIASNPLCLTL